MENENSERWETQKDVGEVKCYTRGIKVSFLYTVWERIFGWCRAADTEISAMLMVRRDGNSFTVYDAMLPKQECTAASTDMDPDSLAKIQIGLVKKKVPMDHFRCWMHTHYNFSTFWSVTDVDTIDKMLSSTADWLLSIVINQAGDYKCRLDIAAPIRLAIDNIKVDVRYPDVASAEEYKKEIEAAVTKPVYRAPEYPGTAYGGYYSGGYGQQQLPVEPTTEQTTSDVAKRILERGTDITGKRISKKDRKRLKRIIREGPSPAAGHIVHPSAQWPISRHRAVHWDEKKGDWVEASAPEEKKIVIHASTAQGNGGSPSRDASLSSITEPVNLTGKVVRSLVNPNIVFVDGDPISYDDAVALGLKIEGDNNDYSYFD